MVVWQNRTMIVLCQEFCYIKNIRIYIVTWIINNNVASEITCLQKNMVANNGESTPSENLAPSCPSQNSAPLIVSFWNLAPHSHFFSSFPLLPWGRGWILWDSPWFNDKIRLLKKVIKKKKTAYKCFCQNGKMLTGNIIW